jgi:flagellar protein FlaG
MNILPLQATPPEISRATVARPPATPAGDTQPAAVASDPQALKAAVTAANEALKTISTGVEFAVDSETGTTVVRVVEQQTGTVLRQMPSKEMLDIAQALDRLQGLLIRNSA